MSEGAPRRTGAARRAEARRRSTMERFAQASDTGGFHAGSTMFAGLLLYGGIGWLLDRWLGTGWLLPVGILVGAALSIVSLWFRYGVDRSTPPTGAGQATPTDPPLDTGRTDHRPI